MEDEMENTLIAMALFGGSFVQQLAKLYRQGDPINQAKLRAAFMNYFDMYKQMAEGHAKETIEKAKGQ